MQLHFLTDRFAFVICSVVFGLVACEGTVDLGGSRYRDAEASAFDVGPDGGPEAGPEAGPDAGPDGGPDAHDLDAASGDIGLRDGTSMDGDLDSGNPDAFLDSQIDADADSGTCPSAIEICGNGLDDNCSSSTDEGCGAVSLLAPSLYLKASSARQGARFGGSVAISADGTTMAIGAPDDGGQGPGINNPVQGNFFGSSGVVYVFRRQGSAWIEDAFIKANFPVAAGYFGRAVALSANGTHLVVSSPGESSNARGSFSGDTSELESNRGASQSGAVFVYERHQSGWRQTSYLKASNSETEDLFGQSLALSPDGNDLVVGAPLEDSSSTTIDGNENNNARDSGAAYVFRRASISSPWIQSAYIKAPNAQANDDFGRAVSIDALGQTILIGAPKEDGGGVGLNAQMMSNASTDSGAAYVFALTNNTWSFAQYVKAARTQNEDEFGAAVALHPSGQSALIGIPNDSSDGMGVDATDTNDSGYHTGGAYLVHRGSGAWPNARMRFFKASNRSGGFGSRLSFAPTGDVFAIGAPFESGSSRGVNGNQSIQNDNSSGAVYVFRWNSTTEEIAQFLYLKASNTGRSDQFGYSLAVSSYGNSLVVGAQLEASCSNGLFADPNDDGCVFAGAGYLYESVSQ